MTSRGFLWIGTNLGMILTVALPRLRDGVPRIWDRPWVSCHAHSGPVRFLIPIYCDTVNVWNNTMVASQDPVEETVKVQVFPKDGSLPLPTLSSTYKLDMVNKDPGKDPYHNPKRHHDNINGSESQVKKQFQKELRQVLNPGSPLRTPVRTSVYTLLDKASPQEEVNLYYSDLLKCDEDVQQLAENKEVFGKEAQSAASAEPEENLKIPTRSKTVTFKPAGNKNDRKITRRTSSVSLRFPHGSNHGSRVSALDTLRKRNCNAVMIISGGDGYLNCNIEQKETRNDEASLMMWMYKF